jgi:hypothetical protein
VDKSQVARSAKASARSMVCIFAIQLQKLIEVHGNIIVRLMRNKDANCSKDIGISFH